MVVKIKTGCVKCWEDTKSSVCNDFSLFLIYHLLIKKKKKYFTGNSFVENELVVGKINCLDRMHK